jgi:hypothetical protein
MHLSLAGVGVLDNAAGHENDSASKLLTARHLYFLGQSAKFLASPMMQKWKPAFAQQPILGQAANVGIAADGNFSRVMRRMSQANQALATGFAADGVYKYVTRPAVDGQNRSHAQRAAVLSGASH